MIEVLSPEEWRHLIRQGKWERPTAGLAPGYAQCNLVVLPRVQAYDFLVFCHRNPKACPILEITEVGSPYPQWLAAKADLRTDLPRYRIYAQGELVEERTDILSIWQEDWVAFLLGCSFSFEAALLAAGLSVRHLEEAHNVPMYTTRLPCKSAGTLRGFVVVMMRPFRHEEVTTAVMVTSRYRHVHGAPLHIGCPEHLGIHNLQNPDFGVPSTIKDHETPVFWACGVTAQAVAMESKLPLMITHAPGHMFISDRHNEELTLF